MEDPDGGMVLAELGEDGAVLVRRMDGVKAKGEAMFAAAQAAGDLGGIDFTAGSVRAVAERVARRMVRRRGRLRPTQGCKMLSPTRTTEEPRRPRGAETRGKEAARETA